MRRMELFESCRKGVLETVKYLLEEKKVIPDSNLAYDGTTPLSISSRKEHLEIVKILIRYGSNVDAANENGDTSLHNASSGGHLDVVKELIGFNGCKVDVKNDENVTPLLLATYYEHLEVCKYLIEKGADINFCDSMGDSPSLLAKKKNNEELLKLFLKN